MALWGLHFWAACKLMCRGIPIRNVRSICPLMYVMEVPPFTHNFLPLFICNGQLNPRKPVSILLDALVSLSSNSCFWTQMHTNDICPLVPSKWVVSPPVSKVYPQCINLSISPFIRGHICQKCSFANRLAICDYYMTFLFFM